MSSVLIVSGHKDFNTGGVGTHLRVLHEEMVLQNVENKFILGKSKFFSGLSFFYRKINKLDAFGQFKFQVLGLSNQIKKNLNDKVSIIDCHDFPSLVSAIRLKYKYKYKYKVIYTVHAPFYEQYSLMSQNFSQYSLDKLKEIELLYLNKCDGFVCVDDKQRDIIEKKLSRKISNIVLPNAVNLRFLDTFICKGNSEKYIVISRHLYKKCGVHIGIEGFSKANIDPEIKLIIVGMGDEFEALTKQVGDLKLEDRVIFKGRLPYEESISCTANAIASLVPSIPLGDYVEATSLSMLEGMALGVPVIASNIGGLKQVLHNTNAGILVEPNNADAIAQAIEKVIKDEGFRHQISINSRCLIEGSYSSKNWLKNRLNFYKS
ncbi:glycosyltransferase family 4 protein [Acinetobacter sp. YH12054]|uniref:glycosyltransferase family 4 protein n=1 Tax=Acinetobacter sp. YH12054 TaxID=2601056 RepID=UPI0015D1359E|nr:glycosyltransferase family 4 protein [Acinetobacter sp. YH12054]